MLRCRAGGGCLGGVLLGLAEFGNGGRQRGMISAATCAHSVSDSVLSSGAARNEQCHTGLSQPGLLRAASGWASSPARRRRSGDPLGRRSGSSSAGSANPATKCGSVCSLARPGPYRYRSKPLALVPRSTFAIAGAPSYLHGSRQRYVPHDQWCISGPRSVQRYPGFTYILLQGCDGFIRCKRIPPG